MDCRIFRRKDGASRLLSGNDSQRMPLELRASPHPPSMQIPGIGDEPNDGAEHGRDQHGARLIIDLIHAPTMRRAEPAIKSQLIQYGPSRAIGQTEDNLL
jgi:hypothetical protein